MSAERRAAYLADGDLIGRLIPRGDEVRLSDDLLRRITVPTLFWWGADDTFDDEAVARRIVATMPQAEPTTVPERGHLPWLDDPEGAATATLDLVGGGAGHR